MPDVDARVVVALERRVYDLERQLNALTRRLGAPFALGRSTLDVDDTGAVQLIQAQLDSLSARDNVPMLYHHGFTSSPPINADLHVAFLDGDRSRAVVTASGHQTYRLRNLGSGDAALYDSRAAYVWLTATGPVINCAGGNPATVQGDLHVTGKVISNYGTTNIELGAHLHQDSGGVGNSGPPVPGT